MAWPLTPFRTMVDTSTFWDAALGNALQSGVNSLYSGGLTLRSLQTDGVGANNATAAAGAIVASGAITAGGAISGGALSGTTLGLSSGVTGGTVPTPAFSLATLYKDIIPVAWAYVAANGTLSYGANISAISHTASSGVYGFTLNTGVTSTSRMCIAGSLVNAVGFLQGSPQTATTFNVNTYNSAAAATDSAFAIVVFGA